MSKLSTKLGFRHDNLTPYYTQASGHVEAMNKILKNILQQMIRHTKSSWNLQLFSTLWAYRTMVKMSINFTLFQLVYGLEATLLIECEIPSMKLALEILPNTT